jgi:subtilisin family serine protease
MSKVSVRFGVPGRWIVPLLVLLVSAAIAAPVAAQPPSSNPGHSKSDRGLGEFDRANIAAAAAEGEKTVTLLIAAEPGQIQKAASGLKALGGVVQAQDKAVDYLKVDVPINRAEEAAAVDGIAAVDVDGLIPMDDPEPNGAQNPIPQTPPSASTPQNNPYMPIGDTGAAQFLAANSTWDGRGATIAVLDSGTDLDHPALQTTTTGENKIIDWYNANATNSGDGTWVPTTGRFNGSFTALAATWTAPATGGPYAFGRVLETRQDLAAGELGGDVDRDGVTGESIGVLQDRTTKQVYVDVDQDRDFTNNTPMIDFKVNRDVGHFGTDNAATQVVERVAFVVVTDRSVYDPTSDAGSFVNIGIAGAAHGTHTAGITTANALFGGAMTGAAPGAKLIAVKVCLTTTACTSSGLIDGVLYAAHNGADVVNISIGGLPGLNDGNNARAVLYNNTIAEFDMQIFISSGNSGAGANTVGDPSVASDAISVGAYITKETWLSNYGSEITNAQNLHPFSSRGPREDGGMKPQIVAPGAAVSTIPPWQPGGPVAGTYALPAGYAMMNGTSMAAPQATGAAALLVSAYKATHGGAKPDVEDLRNAILSGATFLPNIGAYEQGMGLLNVGAAWTILNSNPAPRAVSATVPVNTIFGSLLATPNVGIGIHDREGVVQGQQYTRTYTIKRTTGPNKAIPFNLKWLGNDGTFKARGGSAKINLPLNIPVLVDVQITPSTPGVHSAILVLDDPTTVGNDVMTMNTVFVPNEFTAANAFSFQTSGTVGRNSTKHFFVRVPEGASALKVDMVAGGDTTGAGQVRFLRYDPQGLPVDSNASTSCYNPAPGGGSCAGGTPTSRTATNPLPGVWELIVEARRTSDSLTAPFSLSATVLGAAIDPNPDVVPSATIGVPQERNYTVTNLLAGFNGRLVGGGSLASRQSQRPTVAHLGTAEFDVTLPSGVSSWNVRTLNPSDPRADIDLVVFRCTAPNVCTTVVGSSGSSTSNENVTVNNPPAATYRILLDGFSIPEGTSEVDLIDTYASAALGSITSSDANADHSSGTSWSPTATLTVNGQPGAGRQIVGTVSIQTDADVAIGSGSVVVESVTP